MTMLARIAEHARQQPAATAVRWPGGELGYAALLSRVEHAIALLSREGVTVVALDLGNGPDWLVFDLAALALDLCVVPLPAFFSAAQLRHAVTRAGVEVIISDRPDALRAAIGNLVDGDAEDPGMLPGNNLHWLSTTAAARRDAVSVPAGVNKLTFTSGTTGAPKGVPLRWAQMRAVTTSLVAASGLDRDDNHLALMPLAVLLENIGGVYAPLWAGACVTLAALSDVGLRGAVAVDGTLLAQALIRTAATTAIFTPQTLQALVEAIEGGNAARPPLRFAAVGGAPVSPRLLQRAAQVGIPVYEGYGLSECSSVVCLNTPAANRPGSVGRPLGHVDIRIAADGEIVVHGSGFGGYLGDAAAAAPAWHTGDIGEIDADGFLHLRGRRRNVFITSFGRNVAPEWVERELTLEPAIAQVAVFGEARPFNVAVITAAAGATTQDVEAAIARANRALPDYARVGRWVASGEPFSPGNGLLTGTGRIRREHLWVRYRGDIECIYQEAVPS